MKCNQNKNYTKHCHKNNLLITKLEIFCTDLPHSFQISIAQTELFSQQQLRSSPLIGRKSKSGQIKVSELDRRYLLLRGTRN